MEAALIVTIVVTLIVLWRKGQSPTRPPQKSTRPDPAPVPTASDPAPAPPKPFWVQVWTRIRSVKLEWIGLVWPVLATIALIWVIGVWEFGWWTNRPAPKPVIHATWMTPLLILIGLGLRKQVKNKLVVFLVIAIPVAMILLASQEELAASLPRCSASSTSVSGAMPAAEGRTITVYSQDGSSFASGQIFGFDPESSQFDCPVQFPKIAGGRYVGEKVRGSWRGDWFEDQITPEGIRTVGGKLEFHYNPETRSFVGRWWTPTSTKEEEKSGGKLVIK